MAGQNGKVNEEKSAVPAEVNSKRRRGPRKNFSLGVYEELNKKKKRKQKNRN